MHTEILTKEQSTLLPLVKSFSSDFYMVGGTAVALQLGHRRSIDFDLFTNKQFNNSKIRTQIKKFSQIDQILYESNEELTLTIKNVKMTFFQYPYKVPADISFNNIIKMPDVLTIAAMKAFALGQRAKWKDYVDLYFILQNYELENIARTAKEIFKGEFNERLFREQLGYFEDVNYKEKVEYMPGFEIADDEIKKNLANISIEN